MKTILPLFYFLFSISISILNAQMPEWITYTTLNSGLPKKPVGDYSIDWNVAGFGSGIYFCWLQAGSFMATKKLFLQK